jgi:feruloyl esterase
MQRVREVSSLMDSTDADLSAFQARGGKLVVLEHMADYAHSPYAGIEYFKNVSLRLGRDKVDGFMRLYTAPGVDHVGTGAPANVDMLGVLADWVERGVAPGTLEVVAQPNMAPFAVSAALPLCRWPAWPRYRGSGAPNAAASFECIGR